MVRTHDDRKRAKTEKTAKARVAAKKTRRRDTVKDARSAATRKLAPPRAGAKKTASAGAKKTASAGAKKTPQRAAARNGSPPAVAKRRSPRPAMESAPSAPIADATPPAPSDEAGTPRSIDAANGEAGARADLELPARTYPVPIVGIGASAGGLDALSALLPGIPADTRMALIVVLHLDPSTPSFMVEILARTTALHVVAATSGTVIESGYVYVLPPNAGISIKDGVLTLSPRETPRTPPIDDFFRSLAVDQGPHAFGVILSGTASDGALGAKALKTAGGITFAQDEASARHADMPRAAVALGAIDYVMAPRDIAAELTRLCDNRPLGNVAIQSTDEHSDGDESLVRILGLLRRNAALDFANYKESTVRRRILRRMSLHRRATLADYAQYLEGNPGEVGALCQDILINVTAFFRDPETFASLKSKVLPELMKDRGGEPLRVWVPGCSTGEEAYSLAISIAEYASEAALEIPIQLFATDVSEGSLARARDGSYSDAIAVDVSADRLRRYFTKTERGYRISKAIRDMCVFARHNLTRDPPFSKIDLISCRNVLIYMGPTLQRRVLHIFHYALRAGRFLVLGSSESIGNLNELFSIVDRRSKFYVKEDAPIRFSLDAAPAERMVEREAPSAGLTPARWQLSEVVREAERRLLDRFAPAAVLLDDRLQVLHVRGSTGDYLEPAQGAANLDFLRMVREPLRGELRGLLQSASKLQTTVRKDKIPLGGARSGEVGIEIIPLRGPSQSDRYRLIVFDRSPSVAPPAAAAAKRAGGRAHREDPAETARLTRELGATKEYLQSIVEEVQRANEELRSANEEVQSGNEELQSTNEELETAKEELQSTNEELTTVNEELQNRNLELGKVNNDYANLLSSIHIPIVMLDAELRIRRFTPMAGKLMNLIATDVGRPISDMQPNFDLPDLDRRIREVLDTLHIHEAEVRDRDGHFFMLRIRPYRTSDNKIDGAVLALIESDALHRSNLALVDLKDHLDSIISMVDDPLLVVDGELHILLANAAFAREFSAGRALAGMSLESVDRAPWNDRELRRALLEDLPKTSPAASLRLDLPGQNDGVVRVEARLAGAAADTSSRIIVVLKQQRR